MFFAQLYIHIFLFCFLAFLYYNSPTEANLPQNLLSLPWHVNCLLHQPLSVRPNNSCKTFPVRHLYNIPISKTFVGYQRWRCTLIFFRRGLPGLFASIDVYRSIHPAGDLEQVHFDLQHTLNNFHK